MTCLAPSDLGGGFRHSDLERAAEALSMRLQPQDTALTTMNGPVMQGRMLLHEVQPGLHATGYDMKFEVDLPLVEEIEEDVILCSTLVSGESEPMVIDGHEITFSTGGSRLIFVPKRRVCIGSCVAGTQGAVAGFSLRRAWLDQFAQDDGTLDPLRQMFEDGVGSRVLREGGPLRALAGQLLSQDYLGALGRINIESAVLASVVAVTGVLAADIRVPHGMSGRQLRRVEDARDILAARLANPPSMEELCRWVGVNPTTLRAQFKATFGTTVFGWLRDRRLEVAQVMLAEGEHSVTEIGWRVGFSNPGAFATAYRRRFGYPPTAERNRPAR